MGNEGAQVTESSSEQHTELPWYMQRGSLKAYQMANERTSTPWEGYGGQRVADMSANERQGIQKARDDAEAGDADFAGANAALDKMSSFTDEGVAEKYMNPFIEQVMQPGLRRKNEAFEQERARRKQGRGMTGAFGDRGYDSDQKFERGFSESQDEYMGSMRGAAYSEAANLHGAEMQTNLQEASAYGKLAMDKASESSKRIYNLMNTGLQERTQEQADLDFQYIEAIEERDWDVNNLSVLVETLRGIPHNTSSYGSSTSRSYEEESPLKMVAGVAMIAGGGMMGGFGALAAGASE